VHQRWTCLTITLIFIHTLQFLARQTFSFIVEETVDLGDGSVEGNNGETVISSVQDQVLAHDGQTNETEITTRLSVRRKAGGNASQTRTKVSMAQSMMGVCQ